MKSYPIILLLFILTLLVYSCTDTVNTIGAGIQPTSDQIQIGTDTFHLSTENVSVDYIISKPDSFLLGTYFDTKFGSTQADILAQFNCPVGFKFPPLSVPDSASIELAYRSWFGSKSSPLDVNIYEMNLSTFAYPSLYKTNLDPSEFTDKSIKLAERIFSAKDAVKLRADTTAIVFQLKPDFVQRFKNSTDFSSTNNFLKNFKGVYITANYGSATLLNINQVSLRYYYHNTYTSTKIHGGDSTVVVKYNLFFPANSEVRQVNRFLHPDRNTVVQPTADVNYIASPANSNTRVGIPLNKIKQRMDAGIANKKLTINSAILKVEATNIDVDTVRAPTVRYMLLIKESAIDRFFNNKELPSDTCAMLAGHSIALVANATNVYQDYYSFSVAKLVANEMKIAALKGIAPTDKLNMRLIPVQVTFDANSNPTSVKQSNSMSAVTIKSGKNPTSPMKIDVVYSGF